ncbi:hypothetical protein H0H93_007344, partial [Arthromyces matolae]
AGMNGTISPFDQSSLLPLEVPLLQAVIDQIDYDNICVGVNSGFSFLSTTIIHPENHSPRMPATIPQDLLYPTLSNLCGTPSIRRCALVCREWLRVARYHLLPPPQLLDIDPLKMPIFLALYESPLSSLKYVSFRVLYLHQSLDPRKSQPGFYWRNREPSPPVDIFLTKNLPFLSAINQLYLEGIDWDTLSQSAIVSLSTSFTSVRTLQLQYLAIKQDQLSHLLTGLPTLETLQLGVRVPFDSPEDPLTLATDKIHHPNLHQLFFGEIVHPSVVRFLAHNVVYDSGIDWISADLRLFGSSHDYKRSEHFQVLAELLKTAGEDLKRFDIWAMYIPFVRDERGGG